MTDVTPPIVVDPNELPSDLGAGVRYIAMMIAGWLVSRGVLSDQEVPLLIGIVMAVTSFGYAIYRKRGKKAQAVALARSAPIGRVVGEDA